MSPGATMERVYLEIKARIMAGQIEPGARLDPVHLARELAASATPVRDALHRLTGERLIESWHQDGFRQPVCNENDLRDLYSWSQLLLGLALRAPGGVTTLEGPVCAAEGDDYIARIGRLFRAIGLLSPNRELRYAIANLVDRSHVFRRAEIEADPASLDALAVMESAFQQESWPEVRGLLQKFHRRRIAQAGAVALRLRPVERQLGQHS